MYIFNTLQTLALLISFILNIGNNWVLVLLLNAIFEISFF